MPQIQPILIGIDVGTSSVKAVMSSADGETLDTYTSSHETWREEPGAAEQDPGIWMQHVRAALVQFEGHSHASRVVGIGVTSQVNTHIFCDEQLQPLRPAITWQDTRPAAQAAALDGAISEQSKIEALGAPIPIDASHALSRMAWVATNEPSVWNDTKHVLLPKDHVIAQLTGEVSADPISSIGLVGTDHTYAPQILDLLPGAADLLATLRDPLEIVGNVSVGQPFAGTPVCCGTMDAWASMFGLGVASEGQAMYLSGTSEVLGLISSSGQGYPGIVTFPSWRDIRLHAGPTQSGGASLNWLSRLLEKDIGELAALPEGNPITVHSPLFLPHLEGERAPLWDPASRGGFSGLTSAHGQTEIIASVMEGVAFSARWALEAIEKSADQPIKVLRHGGGGATSNTWCQIRANALGRALERVASRDAGATGAQVMAGVACGELASLGEATANLISTDRTFDPDTNQTALADERFERFQQLYQQLKPLNDSLAPGPT